MYLYTSRTLELRGAWAAPRPPAYSIDTQHNMSVGQKYTRKCKIGNTEHLIQACMYITKFENKKKIIQLEYGGGGGLIILIHGTVW